MDVINPNVTVDNKAPTADEIMNSVPKPKVWCVYDGAKLIGRFDRYDEAAAYTKMPGNFRLKEEENPAFKDPEPWPPTKAKRPTKKAEK